MSQKYQRNSTSGKSKKGNYRKKTDAVRPKKHLGQHFLKDETIAQKIADTLSLSGYKNVLEIGPGMGVLTKYLLLRDINLAAMDLDKASITYLTHKFPSEYPDIFKQNNRLQLIEADFLSFDLKALYGDTPFAIIGNFPYNISTQIVFRMLEMRQQVSEFSGMFQKEVAQRICAAPGSKVYGILSVWTQAFYDAEYLFTVPPEVFYPPPKVNSGVLRLIRKTALTLPCNEDLFLKVVKTAFNQRRKTLRNSLKSFVLSHNLKEDAIFGLRPEQLSVSDFITLTQKIAHDSL